MQLTRLLIAEYSSTCTPWKSIKGHKLCQTTFSIVRPRSQRRGPNYRFARIFHQLSTGQEDWADLSWLPSRRHRHVHRSVRRAWMPLMDLFNLHNLCRNADRAGKNRVHFQIQKRTISRFRRPNEIGIMVAIVFEKTMDCRPVRIVDILALPEHKFTPFLLNYAQLYSFNVPQTKKKKPKTS